MICQCPKCESKTQLDLTNISEEGTSAKCPECKTRFWISKESFALRATKKEGKSLCYYCNNELNNYIDCPGCGMMYPDYCVVHLTKPVKKAKRKTSSSLSFSMRSQRRSHPGSLVHPESLSHSTKRASKKLLVAISILILVAVLAVALGIPYYNKRLETTYTAGYLYALNGIKLGTDLSLKECGTIIATAKSRSAAGQGADLRVGEDVTSRLNSAKTDVDAMMKTVPAPPQKYAKANENLVNLYGIYVKSHTLASAPSGTVQSFSDSAAKLEGEFKQSAAQLKSNLPPELAQAYQDVLPKYKALRVF
jgi:hypothetical protein